MIFMVYRQVSNVCPSKTARSALALMGSVTSCATAQYAHSGQPILKRIICAMTMTTSMGAWSILGNTSNCKLSIVYIYN